MGPVGCCLAGQRPFAAGSSLLDMRVNSSLGALLADVEGLTR